MKRVWLLLFIAIQACVLPLSVNATQIKAYVSEFAVAGVQGRDELKTSLQTMLASRMSSSLLMTVDKQPAADVVIKGSYIVFGKIFSIDVVARDQSGLVLARSYQQGESQDELIPAVGKLAAALTDDITKAYSTKAASPLADLKTATPLPVASAVVKSDVVRRRDSEIIKVEELDKKVGSTWISRRITGAMTGIALGKTLASGDRELYIAGDGKLQLYSQGTELKLLGEAAFDSDMKVLSLDTADLDSDGNPEVYVTLMSGDFLVSQVWQQKDGSLRKLGDKLPYYFRAIALAGKDKRIYAQQISKDSDFYGDVFELAKRGAGYELINPIKLPRFGYLYNFNQFADAKGTIHTVVVNDDGYLLIYSLTGEELWRSGEKFGGSTASVKREDLANFRTSGDQYRWKFLEQRIIVSKDGQLLVPRNSGMFVLGNQRSYNKNSIFSFIWNGSSLEEKWHTRDSQNYLADFWYDEIRKELILLEIVKPDGVFSKGASAVAVKRVE